MAYKYTSITPGIFSFTIPGENRTVKLFTGDSIIVEKQLNGTYLKMFTFEGEVESDKKVSTKPKAKVADKITSVIEQEEITVDKDNIDVVTEDVLKPVEEKPAPKKRGRKKKVD
jgi:hypothetical protein